jgi:hypothetical protein
VFTRQVGSGVVVKVVLGGSYLVKYGARRLEDLAALLRSRNETKVGTGPWKSRSSLCLTLMFPFGRQWKVSSDTLDLKLPELTKVPAHSVEDWEPIGGDMNCPLQSVSCQEA